MPITKSSKKRKLLGQIEEYSSAEWQALHKFYANDDNVIWLYPPANVKLKLAKQLRHAVRAAIKAYARTGKMLDAALAYAAHGLPVFPLTHDKTPVPPRDNDANGNPIPGTGSFKKATTDPIQIRAWWKGNEYLIGLPMGAASGVWCLDVDTSEDHADGVAEWKKIVAQHVHVQQHQDKHSGQRYEVVAPPFVTREHRSATDGPHLIFNWHPEQTIRCGNGELPDGISVKGEGGYIVVPPSRRKGRSYSVYRDINPIDPPQWLTDLILQGRTRFNEVFSGPVTGEQEEVADAMSFIPNDDLDWEEWTAMGMRLFAASKGQAWGFKLFNEFSQKSDKYDATTTIERWEGINSSPPTRTGVGKIFKIAREHGWVRKGEPTYPLQELFDADMARRKIRSILDQFLHGVAFEFPVNSDKKLKYQIMNCEPPPPVWAIWIDTGLGKTLITIEVLAKWLRDEGHGKIVIYAVPRHRLGENIDELFVQHGINARQFYGRGHTDPEHVDPDKADERQIKMCLRPEAVELAIACQTDVTQTCCKDGKKVCPAKGSCGYYRQQLDAESVQVWIVASDMLFHAQKILDKAALVIIDESIWQKGLRGVEREKGEEGKWEIALDSLGTQKPDVVDMLDPAAELASLRYELAQALRQQDANGGVEYRQLERISDRDCDRAIQLEWDYLNKVLIPQTGLSPTMSDTKFKSLAKNKELIDSIKHSRRIIRIWREVRNILKHWYEGDDDNIVSGRLTLTQSGGQRVVDWKGVDEIKQQFRVPTLMLDATLPQLPVLQIYHPEAEIVADIKAALPECVRVRQVLNAPTSSSKLIGNVRVKEDERLRNLHAIRRYIMKRYIETGRNRTLVVCQLGVELWLRVNLPPEVLHTGAIMLAHLNAISGLDEYKHVRLLIAIGRTAPGPWATEILTGALTGRQPQLVARSAVGYTGYPQINRCIRLRDGSGHKVDHCDQHPDPFTENVRWLICEGELIQAIGRARGVNRETDEPLDIDILSNIVLPISVDEVTYWKMPSPLIETAAEGHMLTAPIDMTKVRRDLWPNRKAATRTLKQGVPNLPGFVPITYQLKGSKMNQRIAYFDLNIIPDPRAWLEAKLDASLL